MIGYYVHHHGRGHLHRMTCITQQLQSPVTALSTLSPPPDFPHPWVQLAPDVDDTRLPGSADVTANGTLHWVPAGHDGLRTRMAAVAAWIADVRPSVMVVDVSVEIAVFVRAMGIPVVVLAMPGDRTDRPHRLAYDLATALVAPWPDSFRDPTWPDSWHRKTLYAGAFSRYDDRMRQPAPPSPPGQRRRVAVLGGHGGLDVPADEMRRAADATPLWQWDLIGVPGGAWVDDPWHVLSRADVVVTHAGQNAVAEVASIARPAIVVPQTRPHDEQRATAQRLRIGNYATVLDSWPSADCWPDLLDRASTRPVRWHLWAPGDGAYRVARHIDALASSLTTTAR